MTLKWMAVVVAAVVADIVRDRATSWSRVVHGGQRVRSSSTSSRSPPPAPRIVLAVVADLHDRLNDRITALTEFLVRGSTRSRRTPATATPASSRATCSATARTPRCVPFGRTGTGPPNAESVARRTDAVAAQSRGMRPHRPGYAGARAAVRIGQPAPTPPAERRAGLAGHRRAGRATRALLRLRRHPGAGRRRPRRRAARARRCSPRSRRSPRVVRRVAIVSARPVSFLRERFAALAARRPLRPLRPGAQPRRRRDRHRAGRAALGARHGRAGRARPRRAARRRPGRVQAAVRRPALPHRPAARRRRSSAGARPRPSGSACGSRPAGWCSSSSPRSTRTRAW